MAEEVAALNLRLEATIRQFETQLQRANRTMNSAARKMETRAQGLNKNLELIGARFGIGFQTGAMLAERAIREVGQAITDVVRNGDRFRQLEGRFAAITGSAERGAAAFQNVLSVATGTGVAIDDVASAVTRFTIASEAIGATDDQVRQLTQTILQLGAIGGGSTQELASGAQQLGQALASGKLAGDELRSILENMPLVAKAIADGLGVGVGQLRKMGEEGKLTARLVFDALLGKAEETQRTFEALPPSLERSAGRMANAWAKFTAELDRSLGISNALSRSLGGLAGQLEVITAALASPEVRMALGEAMGAGTGASPLGDLLSISGRRRQLEAMLARGVGTPTIGSAPTPEMLARAAEQEAALRGLSNRLGRAKGGTPLNRPDKYNGPVAPEAGGGGGGGGRAPNPAALIAVMDGVREHIELLTQERAAIGLSERETLRYNAALEAQRTVRELEMRAAEEGIALTSAQREEIEALAAQQQVLTLAIYDDTEALQRQQDAQQEAIEATRKQQEELTQLGQDLLSTALRADNFADALKNVAMKLAEVGINALFGQGPAGGGFNKLIGSSGAGILGLLFSAKGNVFSGGNVKAFKRGGIVNGATAFGMKGGMGVMGEAGPEAVVPLKRGADGSLGIAGGGSPTNIYINAPGSQIGAAQQIATTLDRQLPRILRENGKRNR